MGREVGGGGTGTASDMMGLLMVIIGVGLDSNYMVAAQYTPRRLCVCARLFKRKCTQNCDEVVEALVSVIFFVFVEYEC